MPDAKVSKNKQNTVLIKYYGTGELCARDSLSADAHSSWVAPKELSTLSANAIDSFLSTHKKGGGLKEAYAIAKDPESWEQKTLDRQRKALEKFEAGEDDDESEEFEDDPEEGTKKRKRAPAKPKASTSKPAPKKKPKPDGALQARRRAHLADLEPGVKQCREWRNKLQKNFLDKPEMPVDAAMPDYDRLFTNMEKFKAEAQWLFVRPDVSNASDADRPPSCTRSSSASPS